MVVSLSLLFEILAVVACLHYLYGERLKIDLVTVGFIVLEISWMNVIYWGKLDQSWTLMMYPIVVLYCSIRFGFDFKSIFINNILYLVVICTLQATIMLIFRMLFSTYYVSEKEQLVINILVFTIIVFLLKKCKLNKLSAILQSKEKLVVTSLIVVIFSLLSFLLDFKGNVGFSASYYVVFLLSVILISIAAIDIGKHKIKMREAEAELRLHKLYETTFQNLIEDICARQHEFDNHINAIFSQHFLYETYDELVAAQKEYCKDVINENHYNKLLSKGNPIILGFLYGKFSEAEKRGIDISYKINIDDLECSVPIYKIVELLGNLIKNAVEALEDESDINKLQVVMREENSVILIKVANESKNVNYGEIQQFFKKGYSKKGKGRGYGLFNVKRICDEYGAQIQCDIKNDADSNWLMFTVILYKSL